MLQHPRSIDQILLRRASHEDMFAMLDCDRCGIRLVTDDPYMYVPYTEIESGDIVPVIYCLACSSTLIPHELQLKLDQVQSFSTPAAL